MEDAVIVIDEELLLELDATDEELIEEFGVLALWEYNSHSPS